jgi:hypothetical protein
MYIKYISGLFITKKTPLTAMKIAYALLKGIQHIDITVEILTPPTSLHQPLSFTIIHITLHGETPPSCTFQKKKINRKTELVLNHGDHW